MSVHELRTPLTLIISPMESMMKEITDEKLHGKLQLMYRNAQRLLNLVNQLLDFRKNEMAGLHLTLSEGDIVAYVRSICASFLMLSEKETCASDILFGHGIAEYVIRRG